MVTVSILFPLIVGYLLGSIPFGVILMKLTGGEDLRRIGSGNIGATNVLRSGRKSLAVLTLLLDALKGSTAVLLAVRYGGGEKMAALVALAAVFGHVFPCWLKFKGGKGVATAFGSLLALSPTVGVAVLIVWGGVAACFRYSSLAALVSIYTAPILSLVVADFLVAEVTLVFALLISWTHLSNIKRLIKNQEPKIGEKVNLGKTGNN